MAQIKPLIAGNWKMHGLRAALAEVTAIRGGASARGLPDMVDILICPPATLIAAAFESVAGSPLLIGAQDCRAEASGAFTGDLSAPMLADSGASAVILGHSERREFHSERDRDVKAKAMAAHKAGLIAIVCVGETAGERRLGLTLDVIGRQLKGSLPDVLTAANTVIAYEPVWAIGTGLTPTPDDAAEAHAFIRGIIGEIAGAHVADATRILYGGSVKPENAAALLTIPGVNGALVGGASLKADDFLAIISALSV